VWQLSGGRQEQVIWGGEMMFGGISDGDSRVQRVGVQCVAFVEMIM
jgi:hypothetical protein